jgi:hypothetical protein
MRELAAAAQVHRPDSGLNVFANAKEAQLPPGPG